MRFLTSAFLAPAALLVAGAPAALLAQEVVQALPGTTDADRLAEQMRALASNPRDLNALIAAADLSLALGDLSGAASLYARAEKVSASDPRIKAGEGSILVRSERPGEALLYFAQAEAAGYDARGFAADRGLAYDLIGQQERAQRDYRLALKGRPDDETVKRYALSLGISGKRDAALEQLDPLLRKSDRSAWRIRAFVLAMGGDQTGAVKIATTMLPPGMAQGLQPFFQRLPTLPAADRAFAVHFGEVRASPERIADARLAPNLPLLSPEAAPVALASVQPNVRPRKAERRQRGGRNRDAAPPVALASNTRAPQTILPAATTPVQPGVAASPSGPSYRSATAALARVQPLPRATGGAAVTLADTTSAPLPAAIAPSPNGATTVRTSPAAVAVSPAPGTAEAANLVALASTPPANVTPAVARPVVAPTAAVQIAAIPSRPATTTAVASGFTSPPTPPVPATTAPVAVVSAPVPTSPAATIPPASTTAQPASAVAFTAPPSPAEADSVLARIVAGLSIPASELGVAEPVRAAPAPAAAAPAVDTAARVLAEARAKEQRDAAAEKALAIKAAADKRAADRKAVADKKALAAKKLADEKKLADAKAAAEEKKAARANPERIWVQVAGGAYAGDLPKAYAAAKAKAPAIFGSRVGWSTPLRATNRVLTGPFKTDAEARSFVNQLAKAGVSAFTFTSDTGQVVTRLPAK
jgi:tetratricopeptide (TPR) repeat protein